MGRCVVRNVLARSPMLAGTSAGAQHVVWNLLRWSIPPEIAIRLVFETIVSSRCL